MIPEIKIVYSEDYTMGNAVTANSIQSETLNRISLQGKFISFATAKAGLVSVDVFGTNGKRVATLFNGHLGAGSYAFSIGDMPKGMYIVRVKGAGITATQPMLLK